MLVKQGNIHLFCYKQLAKNGGQWSVNQPPSLALITRVITRGITFINVVSRASLPFSQVLCYRFLASVLFLLVKSPFHWTNIYGFSFFLSIKEINWIDGISSSNSSIPKAREDNRSERQLQSNVDGNSVGVFLLSWLFSFQEFFLQCVTFLYHATIYVEYIKKRLASLTRSAV